AVAGHDLSLEAGLHAVGQLAFDHAADLAFVGEVAAVHRSEVADVTHRRLPRFELVVGFTVCVPGRGLGGRVVPLGLTDVVHLVRVGGGDVHQLGHADLTDRGLHRRHQPQVGGDHVLDVGGGGAHAGPEAGLEHPQRLVAADDLT